nr:class II holin family protein [Escherichia coli]
MDKLTTGIAYGTSAGSAGYWFLQWLDQVSPSQWAAIGVLGSLVTGLTVAPASAGAHAHTVGIGAHTHSVAIGSHGHTITVNAAGNAENTVKNIAFNYIVRLA